MSASNSFENGILDLVFLNTDFANIGDAGGLQNSATAGSLYVSLHTSDPGEGGSQTTNEAGYTSYARVAVARSGAGWSRTNNVMSNVAAIEFPQCTGSTATVTHFGIGTDSSGAGTLLFSGALGSSLAVSSTSNAIVRIAAGALTVTCD